MSSGPYLRELAILAETQRFLDYLYHNQTYAKSLRVPDGSRMIFDTSAKLSGLLFLSSEMDDLAREVAREHNSAFRTFKPSLDQVAEELRKSWVPAA